MESFDPIDPPPPTRDEARRFWDLIVKHGAHAKPMSIQISMGCQSQEAAAHLAVHFREYGLLASRVEQNPDGVAEPPAYFVVAQTKTRLIDEPYFVEVHQWIADTVREFGCQFLSLGKAGERVA